MESVNIMKKIKKLGTKNDTKDGKKNDKKDEIVRDVIGEGSYGCVHKPSIHCKTGVNKDFNYDEYVSKIMKTRHAKAELSEFLVIGSYDKTNEYHLGAPVMCSPKLNETVIRDIKKCRNISGEDVADNPEDYKVLLLKFGGPDLKHFCNEEIIEYLKTDKQEKTDKFWLEAHHLLKGLKFFYNNGIVHNDIKPHNILFNTKTGKLKYIDFGLMRKKNEIKRSSEESTNYLGTFHWSYPFDCGFMNREIYNRFSKSTEDTKVEYIVELTKMIVFGNKTNKFGLPIKNPAAFNILFEYIKPNITRAEKLSFFDEFMNGIGFLVQAKPYSEVLNLIIDSIDVFSLGFTLQFMLNCFNKQNAIDSASFTRLSTFFNKMCDFNPATREINIDKLINEYEDILIDTGLLDRLNMKFVNHKPVTKNVIQAEKEMPKNNLEKEKEKEEKKEIKLNFDISDSDSSPFVVAKNMVGDCPLGKTRNPITKRCVKYCKPGQIRDNKFRCVNEKTRKHKSVVSKECPSEKTMNPFTKRCVNHCKPGQTRDNKFRCVNEKTRKHKSVASKDCPPEKTMNPFTKRCVKHCKPGQIRDPKFRCVAKEITL